MDINFPGQVVLIAGGTGGLGTAVSLAFLNEGAKVPVTYRKEQEFLSLKDLAGAKAAALEGYELNVSDEAARIELVTKAAKQHGGLDVLVNTIGGYSGGQNLWDTEPDTLERISRSISTLVTL